MKKSYLMMAAATALFAACSSDDGAITSEKQEQAQNAEVPVVFDAYMNRATTRAGYAGTLTDTELKGVAGGFGVFAYYTDGERYASNSKPNFMYNQQVTYDGSAWGYNPIKYWPNEFGSDAISDQVDRVTFFAYAPWVKADPLTGVVTGTNTENIVGMTRNNFTGDPFIKYISTMDATNSVDLCWGVSDGNFTSSVSTASGSVNNIADQKPFIDVTKPQIGATGKLKFDFKHALAKLNVQIDAVVDATSGPTTALDNKTKIWVRSVTFEGITLKGALNLREGEWYLFDSYGDNKISSGSVTVYDGLKDGKEPLGGAAANELPASLNPQIIQTYPYSSSTLDPTNIDGSTLKTGPTGLSGVTETAQNLFACTSAATEPIFVIPTGEKFKVTIVYDVETYDPNLAFYLSDGVVQGSTIQNCITKEISDFGTGLTSGKAYTLNLHLGMTKVTFDAKVSAWGSETAGSADLPENK